MSVNAKIEVNINASLNGVADLGTVQFNSSISKAKKFVPGTATTGEADILWTDSRSLAASGTESLDLAGGLTNVFGSVITFAEVTALYFYNTGTTAMTIGNAATNAWVGPFGAATHTLTIPAGEMLTLTNADGWAVIAATGDLLKVLNAAGATGTYDIMIIGRSVAA